MHGGRLGRMASAIVDAMRGAGHPVEVEKVKPGITGATASHVIIDEIASTPRADCPWCAGNWPLVSLPGRAPRHSVPEPIGDAPCERG